MMSFSIKTSMLILFPLMTACSPEPYAIGNQGASTPGCELFNKYDIKCDNYTLSKVDIKTCKFYPEGAGNPVSNIGCLPSKKEREARGVTGMSFYSDGSYSEGVQ
jgi:hypothetical protein